MPAEFFDVLWSGVQSAAVELAALGAEIQSFTTHGHDVHEQKRILSELAGAGYGAIALVPADASALDELIGQHAERGTQIVTFNSDAPASQRHSYVGANSRKAGALAGELLAKLMGGRGRILSFPGQLGIQNQGERYEGFLEAMALWGPEIQLAGLHHGYAGLGLAVEAALENSPGIDGIYVGFARAYEVAKALERRGVSVPCVGFNHTEAVSRFIHCGLVSAIIDESTYQQGYMAVQQAYQAAGNAAACPDRICIPSTVVFAADAVASRSGESLNDAFEYLVRHRTMKLQSYQTRLEAANRELVRMAETDELTGLWNRRKFNELLRMHLERANGVALILLDIDRFKDFNDGHGHSVGDSVLASFARMLRRVCDPRAHCARIGGDEFCIVMPDATLPAAQETCGALLSLCAKESAGPASLNLRVSASIGIAVAPQDGRTPEELLLAADRAMYFEKRRKPITGPPKGLLPLSLECVDLLRPD